MKKFISKLTAVTMAGLFLATPCVYGMNTAKKRPRPANTQTTARTNTIGTRDRDYNMVGSHDGGIKTISAERKQEIITTIWFLEGQADVKSRLTCIERSPEAMNTWRRSMMTLLNQLPKFDAILILLEIMFKRQPELKQNIGSILESQGIVLDSSHILLMQNAKTGTTELNLFICPIRGMEFITLKF